MTLPEALVKSTSAPKWLQEQIDAGKEVYRAASGGGMCFTCHKPMAKVLRVNFLTCWFWLGLEMNRLIKISMYGLMGEIEVNDWYNNVMAPPGIPPSSLTTSKSQMYLPFAMTGAIRHLRFSEEASNDRASLKIEPPCKCLPPLNFHLPCVGEPKIEVSLMIARSSPMRKLWNLMLNLPKKNMSQLKTFYWHLWYFVLSLDAEIFVCSFQSMLTNSFQPSTGWDCWTHPEEAVAERKFASEERCASCHQANGLGIESIPSSCWFWMGFCWCGVIAVLI